MSPLDLDLTEAARLAAGFEGRWEPDTTEFTARTSNLYDPPETQSLLRSALPLAEAEAGRPLAPSHAFVRRYEPGAVLREHIDRPGLDWTISVDLTDSGWALETRDGNGLWRPLPGRVVVVNGRSVMHRRSRYDGVSPAVILLLHYTEQVDYRVIPALLGPDDIARVYAGVDLVGLRRATIGDQAVVSDNRTNRVVFLGGGEWEWLRRKLRDACDGWSAPLGASVEVAQFSRYGPGEHYGWHRDRHEDSRGHTAKRAVSVMVELRAAARGGGFELRGRGTIPLRPGDGVIFPSSAEHRAIAVEEGHRDSLVLWVPEA